jgi:2-polyprenyl-3-methyl-5-hydroxy-6-metoxy-1,4-benzoquinol methylase
LEKFDKELDRCVLCGSKDIYHYHTVSGGIKIYKCKSCGVQFMNPQYSDEYLSGYYSKYTKDEPQWEEPLLYYPDYYLSLIKKYTDKGRLLDIGSGKGYLLESAFKRGWETEGYDLDESWNKKLSKKLNIEIKSGNFPELTWDKIFDVVIMHHVIEHLKNPVLYIDKIKILLKEGGLLFLVQPNINSRSAIFKRTLEKTGIRKTNVGAYYDTNHHLFYYTPAPLKLFLSKNGFEVLSVKSGHAARPDQSKLKRFYLRNISDKMLWKSTFLMICRKK